MSLHLVFSVCVHPASTRCAHNNHKTECGQLEAQHLHHRFNVDEVVENLLFLIFSQSEDGGLNLTLKKLTFEREDVGQIKEQGSLIYLLLGGIYHLSKVKSCW